MKIDNNADLKKLTTFKMGGTVSKLYTPETEDELINLIQDKHPQYFIGGGSNIIINTRVFDSVVNLSISLLLSTILYTVSGEPTMTAKFLALVRPV